MSAHRNPVSRSRSLTRLAAASARLSACQAAAIATVVLAVAGVADVAIGGGVSMALFYATAIVFAAWRLGRGAGFLAVAVVVLLTVVADHRHALFGLGTAARPSDSIVPLWNAATNTVGALMLAILAAALRSAIEHERRRASIDALTGGLNRAAFADRLEAELAAARSGCGRRILACVDLDGFKAVNDAHGHAVGDRLLARFARGIAEGLDDGELFARIGGDEFALVLALAPGEGSAQRAVRLQCRLADLLDADEPEVTCSTGAVALPGPGEPPSTGEALLAAADALMYEVKRSGRNGIRVGGASRAEAPRLVWDAA